MLIRMWKDKSGPCMQLLHFSFAFGAFMAPLIAKQFISAQQDTSNSTAIMPVTNQTGSSWAHGSGDSIMRNTSDTNIDDSQFKIAFWISSSMFIPTLLAFIFYTIRYDIMRHFSKKTVTITNPSNSATTVFNNVFDEENDDDEIEPGEVDEQGQLSQLVFREDGPDLQASASPDSNVSSDKTKNQPLYFRALILILLCNFMFLYVGLEVAYGSWIFTVAVTGSLELSKSQGTVIQSLFWGMFAFARLFSVLLALLNVKASVMMAGNLTGSMVASIIMISFPHNAPAIWLASAVLGMSYASIYPTGVTWMSETIEATGKATSVMVTGGIVGDITVPAAVGGLIAKTSPDALFYATFVGVTVCSGIVALMFLTANIHKKRQDRLLLLVESNRTDGGQEECSDEEKLMDNDELQSDREDSTAIGHT